MAFPAILATLAAGLSAAVPLDGALHDRGQQNRGMNNVVEVGGDCSAAAEQVVTETGGQLLSAQPSGDSCVITVLIQGNGTERPRKVRVKVPM